MKTNRKDDLLIFEIDNKMAGLTQREFLQTFYLSKKKIHELYMEKAILINGEIKSQSYQLEKGDAFSIPVFKNEPIDFIPQKMKLDIIYEDDHLLILNKPTGIQVHPDKKDGVGTLVNGVAHYYKEKGLQQRVRYIHRLDIETTGGIIFAKHYLAHSLLDYWLSEKKIKRWYLALASGTIKNKKGKIEAAIGKDRHHAAKRRVAKNGDYALTFYQVKKQYPTYALVELQLQTGRTHQIRVHMAYIGHPLLGDALYGNPKRTQGLKRQALHSSRIEMLHPITREPLLLEIPLPQDILNYIN